ncbi:hypothetical protein [Psychrobacter piscatorii]|uniref:hypothetical protein n=1 Tax=Psychrobacter piscatorii TaxID=554343 RepID=UPI003735D36B
MSQSFGSPSLGGTNETAETIKTKYESNENTNAFTDDDKQKLESIEVASDISSFTAAFNAAFTAAQPTQEEL